MAAPETPDYTKDALPPETDVSGAAPNPEEPDEDPQRPPASQEAWKCATFDPAESSSAVRPAKNDTRSHAVQTNINITPSIECSSDSSAQRPAHSSVNNEDLSHDKASCAGKKDIPDHIWATCFRMAAGSLPDGTAAKIPLVSSTLIALNAHQFCEPRKWIKRVMALLKHFGFLKRHIVNNFDEIIDCARRRAQTILAINTDNDAESEPSHIMGERIADPIVAAAESFSLSTFDRQLDTLNINDRAFVIARIQIQ